MSSDTLERLTINKSHISNNKKNKIYTKVVLIAAVLICLAASVVLWIRTRSISIETVNVSRIFPTQTFTILNASGYVVAQRKAAVASKTTGRLEWIGVEEGSKVAAGQIIARLENRDLQALIQQADAGVANAQANLEQTRAELNDARQSFARQKELLAQGIVSRAEYDASEARFKRSHAVTSGAEAGVASARAQLQSAMVNFDYSLIKAPFSAVVLTKNADVGDIITPLGAAANAKAAVVTIADLSSLQVEADVSESNLGLIKQGQPCEIMLDAVPDVRFRGRVHMVVPTADRTKASILVKVGFVDRDVRILPDMSAKVAFLEREAARDENKPRIAVNQAAIIKQGTQEGVYKVTGDVVKFMPVIRGAKLGDLVEITGVMSGDKIALQPLDSLRDGMRVSVMEKK